MIIEKIRKEQLEG